MRGEGRGRVERVEVGVPTGLVSVGVTLEAAGAIQWAASKLGVMHRSESDDLQDVNEFDVNAAEVIAGRGPEFVQVALALLDHIGHSRRLQSHRAHRRHASDRTADAAEIDRAQGAGHAMEAIRRVR